MDSAEHGVVLFTMGFIFNAKVDIKLVVPVRIYLYLITFAIILTFVWNPTAGSAAGDDRRSDVCVLPAAAAGHHEAGQRALDPGRARQRHGRQLGQ